MKLNEKNSIFFWGKYNKDGYLSQWFESKIKFNKKIHNKLPESIFNLKIFKSDFNFQKLYDININTCEKFMMISKAILFQDEEIYDMMLNIEDPKKLKNLGRKVKNFNVDIWNLYSREIVTIGNYLKFSQNIELQKQIISTDKKYLIESSPYDKIWGIGLKKTDEKALDTKTWNGKNYLGKCLMKVRDILKN
ncbi:MAG: hypothetical protein CMF62_00940 [Magnetococcales bacterium]|nr:hypothetical protein [Magnetococcales bacterium]|tara:strand:+ start:20278 stop:20853 length:576 start_codon:yes stop_codon:yes gene_type:complete